MRRLENLETLAFTLALSEKGIESLSRLIITSSFSSL